MEGRNQFTFYASFYESAKRIRSKAARADLYDAICRYALTGEESNLDKLPEIAAVAFVNVKPNLEASRKKAKAGEKGGSSKKANPSKPEANGIKPQARENGKRGETLTEKEKEGEKEKEYECTPLTPQGGGESKGNSEKDFEQLWNAYPQARRGRYEEAKAAFRDSIPGEQEAEQALSNLTIWKQSDQWNKAGGQYVPYLSNWLTRGTWHETPPVPTGKDVKASCTLGAAELEAIREVLNQPDFEEDVYG